MTNSSDIQKFLSAFIGAAGQIIQKISSSWAFVCILLLISSFSFSLLTYLPWFWFCHRNQHCFCCFNCYIYFSSHVEKPSLFLCEFLLFNHIFKNVYPLMSFPKERFPFCLTAKSCPFLLHLNSKLESNLLFRLQLHNILLYINNWASAVIKLLYSSGRFLKTSELFFIIYIPVCFAL